MNGNDHHFLSFLFFYVPQIMLSKQYQFHASQKCIRFQLLW